MTAPLYRILKDTSWSPQVLTMTTLTHLFQFSQNMGDLGEAKRSFFYVVELGA